MVFIICTCDPEICLCKNYITEAVQKPNNQLYYQNLHTDLLQAEHTCTTHVQIPIIVNKIFI